MGAGAGFGVPLETESRCVGQFDALEGIVKKGPVRELHVFRQTAFIDGETMILAGDHNLAAGQVLYGVVGPVVAELHFYGFCAGRQTQQLVAETNTKQGKLSANQFANRADCVFTGFGVAGAVGQEDAIRLQGDYFFHRGCCRNDGNAAPTVTEHTQYVAFHTKVVGDDVPPGRHLIPGLLIKVPATFRPFVNFFGGDFARQIHALHARERARQSQCPFIAGCVMIDISACDDRTALGSFFPQDACQTARIDAVNSNKPIPAQVIGQVFRCTPVAVQVRAIAHDQSGRHGSIGFLVFGIATGIADMRISKRDQLACIGWIGQNFLVSGHGRVENHFTGRLTTGADTPAVENTAVFQSQHCLISQNTSPDTQNGKAPKAIPA